MPLITARTWLSDAFHPEELPRDECLFRRGIRQQLVWKASSSGGRFIFTPLERKKFSRSGSGIPHLEFPRDSTRRTWLGGAPQRTLPAIRPTCAAMVLASEILKGALLRGLRAFRYPNGIKSISPGLRGWQVRLGPSYPESPSHKIILPLLLERGGPG